METKTSRMMTKPHKSFLIINTVVIALSIGLIECNASESINSDYIKAVDAISESLKSGTQIRNANRSTIIKRFHGTQHQDGILAILEQYGKNSDQDTVKKLVGSFLSTPLNADDWEVLVHTAETLSLAGADANTVSRIINRAGTLSTDIELPLTAEIAARSFLRNGMPLKGLEWTNKAISLLSSIDRYNEHKEIRKRLKRLKHLNELTHNIITHSLGLTIYTNGRKKELQGDISTATHYYESLSKYDQPSSRVRLTNSDIGRLMLENNGDTSILMDKVFIPQVYIEAGKCYLAKCLSMSGRGREVIKMATSELRKEDINEKPYVGEFHLLISREYFLSGDVKRALVHANKLLEWCTIAESTPVGDRFTVPNISNSITSPPKTIKTRSGWGVKTNNFNPSDIINRSTSEWYIDHLRLNALYIAALCEFMSGDTESATQLMAQTLKYDAIDKSMADKGWFSNYERVIDSFNAGRLFAQRSELSLFKGADATTFAMANMSHMTQNWSDAISQYRALLSRTKKPKKRYPIMYAIAHCQLNSGDMKNARDTLRSLSKTENRIYPSWPAASITFSDLVEVNRATDILIGVFQEKGHSEAGLDALMKAAQRQYTQGDIHYATSIFKKIEQIANDNSEHKSSASLYIELIQETE